MEKTLGAIDTPYAECAIVACTYSDGHPALKIIDQKGRLVTYLSLNIPYEMHTLQEDEYFIRDFHENEQIARDALATGLFEDTGKTTLWDKRQTARIWRIARIPR